MAPFLAPIVSLLASEGLDLLSGAIKGGGEKAKQFIEEKTGIPLSETTTLTPEQITTLKAAERTHQLELIALRNADIANARDMQKTALTQTDMVSKRFVYYFAWFWSVMSSMYIGFITFATIPADNVRFADTILGFLLGTMIATIINYFYGTADKNDHTVVKS